MARNELGMAVQTITKKATDNEYLHRDFHLVLNRALIYLEQKYGADAVCDYLTQFAEVWYAPLTKAVQNEGLLALKKHYEHIFKIEGAEFQLELSDDALGVQIVASPAVQHIQSRGNVVSPLFFETVGTVNKTICRGTPFDCELQDYCPETGGYRLQFFRRKS